MNKIILNLEKFSPENSSLKDIKMEVETTREEPNDIRVKFTEVQLKFLQRHNIFVLTDWWIPRRWAEKLKLKPLKLKDFLREENEMD